MEDRRFLSSICALLGTPTRCPLLHGVFCRFEGTRRVKDPVVSTALCARGSALADRRAPHEPRRVYSVVSHRVC